MIRIEKNILIGDNNISKLQSDLGSDIWPRFMQHDKKVNKYWPGLYTDFLGYQFALFDNERLLGVGNSVPLNWNKSLSDLPASGLDWAMEKAHEDFRMNLDSNILIGVQILINPKHQGNGLSYKMLDVMKKIASINGLKNIALPVRPALKSIYPLIPMDDYINWINNEGHPFDPWIRVHIKAGGRIISTCNKSMEISGTIEEWEDWTNMKIQTSGNYIVDKALIPVKVDKEKNIGKYLEPNVWIVHDVG